MTAAWGQHGRRVLAAAAPALLAVAAAPAGDGVERFWTFGPSSLSGDFNDPEQWVDGESLGVPGEADTAVFDAFASYTVSFPADQATDRVILRRGQVTFELAGNIYTLLNAGSPTAGIVVGETETDTAALTVTGGTVLGEFIDVGQAEGAFGALTVTGPAAQLDGGLQLRVGFQGAGLLDLLAGAQADCANASIATGGGSFGDALVTGPGTTWTCPGTLAVGKDGWGALTVQDGAAVEAGDGIIAQAFASFGEVRVSGPGTSWTLAGSLDVGFGGFGTLIVEDGAAVTNELFATLGALIDVPPEAATGHAVITGPGSTWTVNGDLYVGAAGFGRWTLSSGGRVVVNGALFRGDFVPADAPPQTIIELSSAGDYTEHAAITVSGAAEGFDPLVETAGGYVPAPGDEFRVAEAAGGLAPFTFDLPEPPEGLAWQVLADATSVTLRVGRLGDLDGDDAVGVEDFLALLAAWGPCPAPPEPCPADLTGDGTVGVEDLLLLLANWG